MSAGQGRASGGRVGGGAEVTASELTNPSPGLAHCRHLSTVRTHLSALVHHNIIPPARPPGASGGLTKDVWSKYQKDEKVHSGAPGQRPGRAAVRAQGSALEQLSQAGWAFRSKVPGQDRWPWSGLGPGRLSAGAVGFHGNSTGSSASILPYNLGQISASFWASFLPFEKEGISSSSNVRQAGCDYAKQGFPGLQRKD